MKLIRTSMLAISMLLLLSACEQSAQNDKPLQPIEISNAWIRWMPPAVNNSGAFFMLTNNTGTELILESVEAEWAHHVMMHESTIVDGMAKMNHIDQVVIMDSVEFKPGGKHIMLMGLQQNLTKGAILHIRLHFAGREPLVVPFEVRND